ncbi:tyrosine-type recombinase/integrase [Brevundimonas naejangsanensis]|uniref:tyrosine-type recombinase/integrase n=1 Tax=Brevundimonas naejangsanensis TaxID=588932 RepID=UPI0026EE6A53|nr:site-specific integrase [Brevundimonas naejangsanensis]
MPRPTKPPRLYLRERPGREPVYVILDRGREISTGCGAERQGEAEEAFSRYLADKHTPQWGDGDPARVPVADVLTLYIEEVAPNHSRPEDVAFHSGPLLDYFGLMSCWDITASTCKGYVKQRGEGLNGRRPVKPGTARRELETLRAALGYAYRNRKIAKPIVVHLPEKAPPRTRWLTRSEAARLIAGALGFTPTEFDSSGRPTKWKRVGEPSYHVARFILIALYSGTRHEAVLKLRWGVNSAGGWFDLDRGVLYRRGEGERETRKRRPPTGIPGNLLPHLNRWRRLTDIGPCEYDGRLTLRQKTGFARARRLAKLGDDVTPHILKHTCITWMLQRGVSTWDVAGFTGTSEKTIREVYGHHSPDHMNAAIAVFRGRNLGQGRRESA